MIIDPVGAKMVLIFLAVIAVVGGAIILADLFLPEDKPRKKHKHSH